MEIQNLFIASLFRKSNGRENTRKRVQNKLTGLLNLVYSYSVALYCTIRSDSQVSGSQETEALSFF